MTVPAATVNQYYTGIFRQAPSNAVSVAYQQMPTANDALNSMLSAANTTVDPVVRLYQTAFNRVPDSAGLTAWVPFMTASTNPAQSLQQIANGFTQSTEFLNLYPATLSNAQYVGALYWNILQRQGEDAGMSAWINALNNGSKTRAEVLVGFSNSPEFVNNIEPNVNAFLTAAANNTQTYTGNLFDQGGGNYVTTALTTGADNPVLTAANDVIDGATTLGGGLTWQTWDTLNGGGGNDTLNAVMNGNTVTMTNVSSIETVNLDVSGAAATVNAAVANYIQTLNINSSVGFIINGLGSVPAVSLTGSGANTIGFDPSALAAAGQNLTLTLNGKTAGAVTVNDTGSNALETISIVSSGSANTIGGLITTALGTTTLNVSGSQNVTLGAITDANATLTTVNASTLTGSMSIAVLASSTVTGGSGNDTITSAGGNDSFVGGAGNDTFDMGATLTTADSIDGGDGAADVISTDIATANGLNATRTTQTISNVEILTITDAAAAAAIVTAGIASSLNTVYFNAGTVGGDAVTGPAGTLAVRVGNGTVGALGGALTLTDTGTATTDAATVTLNGANATNAGAGNAITSVGYETVTISTNSSILKGAQTLGAVAITPDVGGTAAVNLTGANALTIGVVTATGGSLDASGLSMTSGAGLTMTAGANTATTITTSAANDTIFGDSVTNRNTTVTAGAGNDTVTTYGGNDSIVAGDGNDSIASGAGNDSIDLGGGNDTVVFASGQLTANDTISGGDGTDILSFTSFTAAADNLVAAQARVSGFETLRIAGTTAANQALTMSNYINNAGFTTLQLGTSGAAFGVDVANASSTLNTVQTIAAVVGANSFDRLTDTSTDALAITNATSGVGAASTMTAFTALDEETITISGTNLNNDLTITTMTVADLASLAITGAGDVIITNAIAGAANLATVDASAASGAVTVNAANSGKALTMTANTSSVAPVNFTGGAFADSITGSGGVDALVGGAGADTINAGAGADAVTAGAGADSVTGGSGADTYNQAAGDSLAATATGFQGVNFTAGDTITFGNGVDVINDFAAGASGDVLNIGTFFSNSLLATATNGATIGWLSGTYANGVFTVAANGIGPDTLVLVGNTLSIATSRAVVLKGVDTDNLVNSNFGGVNGNNVVPLYAAGAFTITAGSNAGEHLNISVAGAFTDDLGNAPTYVVPNPAAGFSQAGLTSVDLSNLGGGFGVNISLAGAVSTGLASVLGTTGNDNAIFATGAFGAANSSVNGGAGVDTLTFTTLTTGGGVTLESTDATGMDIYNIENIVLTAGTVGSSLTLDNSVSVANNGSAVAVRNAGATQAATVVLGTGAAHSYTSASSGIDTVSLGASGQTATLTNGGTNDVIAASAAGASVTTDATTLTLNAGGANGAVLVGNFANSTAGTTDILALANGNTSTTVTTGTITGFETLNIGQSAAATNVAVTYGAGVTGITTLIADTTNGSATFSMTAAQGSTLTTLTNTNGTGTFNLTLTTAGVLNLSSTVVTIGGTGGDVDVLTFAGNNNTLVVNSTNIAKITGTAVAAGTGDTISAVDTLTVANTKFDAFEAITATAGATTIGITDSGVGVARTITGNAGDNAIVLGIATAQKTVDLSAGGADSVSTAAVTAAGRMAVAGFDEGTGGDVVKLGGAATTAFTANSSATTAIQNVATNPGGALTFNTAAANVLELSYNFATVGDLSTATDGTALLAGLGGALSVAADTNSGYILAYQGTTAYLYYAIESADVGAVLAAADIKLVGTFSTQDVGGFVAGNIQGA